MDQQQEHREALPPDAGEGGHGLHLLASEIQAWNLLLCADQRYCLPGVWYCRGSGHGTYESAVSERLEPPCNRERHLGRAWLFPCTVLVRLPPCSSRRCPSRNIDAASNEIV